MSTNRVSRVAIAALAAFWLIAAVAVAQIEILGLLRYTLALFGSVVLPGCALTRWAVPRLDRFERIAVGIPLGIATTTTGWLLLRIVDSRPLYMAAVAMLGSLALVELRELIRERRTATAGDGRALCAVMVLAIVLAVCVGTGLFRPLLRESDGAALYRDVPFDVRYHVAVTSELARSVPPEAPQFAGRRLSYHYFGDLFSELQHTASGVPLFPFLACLQVSTFFVTFVLAAVAFVYRYAASLRIALISVLLMTFVGGPLCFVAGLLLLPASAVWEHIFHDSSAAALFAYNPQIVGLALMFAGLLVTLEYLKNGSWSAAAIAGLLLGSSAAFKTFLGMLVVGGLVLASLISWFRGERRPMIVAAFALVCAAPLLANYARVNTSAADLRAVFEPGYYVLFALDYLQLRNLHDQVAGVLNGSRVTPAALLLTLTATFVLLVGTLGYRIVVVRDLAVAIFDRRASFVTLALAVMFWSGLAAFLFVRLRIADWPEWYNNAGWFHHVGLTVSAIFVAGWIERARREGRRRALATAATLCVIGTATMAQFFVAVGRWPYTTISRQDMEAMDFLRNSTPAESVVLTDAHPYNGGYSNVEMIAERRVFLGADWVTGSIRRIESDRRIAEMRRFYAGTGDVSVLTPHVVDYVLVDNRKYPDIVRRAGGGPACATAGLNQSGSGLRCVFGNDALTIYKIETPTVETDAGSTRTPRRPIRSRS